MSTRSVSLVVLGETSLEPDHLVHAEKGFELRLHLSRSPVGIAVRVELNSASDHDRSVAVDVDASTFVDHRRAEELSTGDCGGERADVLLGLPHAELLLTPTVEPPQHCTQSSVGIGDEGWPAVTEPGLIYERLVDGHRWFDQLASGCAVAYIADQRHRLEASDRVRDRSPRHAVVAEFTFWIGSERGVARRELHPRALVAHPFGRHREAGGRPVGHSTTITGNTAG